MSNESFILYTEHDELVNQLSDEQAGKLLKHLFEYNQTGKVSDSHDPMIKLVFTSIRQDMDRNTLRYKEKCEKMKENGKKGGRPRKVAGVNVSSHVSLDNTPTDAEVNGIAHASLDNTPTDELNKNQKVFLKSKKSLYENENENVNVNVNVNENENGNENISHLSLSSKERDESAERREGEKRENKTSILTQNDKMLLEKYVKRNFPNVKNVRGYTAKLIKNGDDREILKNLSGSSYNRAKRIKNELESTKDWESCVKILAEYYKKNEIPPEELNEIAHKYNLDTIDKVRAGYLKLEEERQEGFVPPPQNCTLEAIKKRAEANKKAKEAEIAKTKAKAKENETKKVC